nr:hypothetical protein [Spirochaeta thermophila]
MRHAPMPHLFLLIGGAILVGMGSCSLHDFLGPYHGVNLLEDHPFPAWTADDGTGTYMVWEEEASVQYDGENAYRLRTCNLLPNGDFEDASDPPTGWAAAGGASVTREIVSPLEGTGSLRVSIPQQNDHVYYPLTSLIGWPYPEGTPLTVRLMYRVEQTISSFPVEYNDTSNPQPDTWCYRVTATDVGTVYHLPPSEDEALFFSVDTSGSPAFLINSLNPIEQAINLEVTLDNVKITRLDAPIWARLSLRASGDTPMELVSGTYRLSFMVRQDPQAGSNNVFPASRIAVRFNTLYDTESGSFVDNGYIHSIPAEPSWDAGWVEVSVEEDLTIFPPANPDDPVVQICISATDPSSPLTMDAGSILVAHPRLELVQE